VRPLLTHNDTLADALRRIFSDSLRMSDVWPQLLESPIVTAWEWSSLVTSGVELNAAHIHPALARGGASDAHALLPGLLALHIRRRDFQSHCKYLVRSRTQWNAINARPDFPDNVDLPPDGSDDKHTPELFAHYMTHCYPSIPQIVARVREVSVDAHAQGHTLDRIYILTNGSPEWLFELKTALRGAQQWKSIGTSRDLWLSREQKYVAQAMDQLVATRAEVFLGNAVCSLPSFLLQCAGRALTATAVVKSNVQHQPDSHDKPARARDHTVLVKETSQHTTASYV
jgi:hypothetical protein